MRRVAASLLQVAALGALAACAAAPGAAPAVAPHLLSWNDIAQRPPAPAGERIAYGDDPLQFGELRLPPGPGPFPVAIVLHGGCWLAEFDIAHIGHLSQALTQLGIATWTLEYRRVGNPGGGWPGTFADVAAGADRLRALAVAHRLDLRRTIAIGHSAGGQLALWLAARPLLVPDSPLYRQHPLAVAGVVALAPITDLAAYANDTNCGAAVTPLMGGAPARRPQRYAQASPLALLPLGVPQRLVHGALDRIVPPAMSRSYAAAASERGDDVQLAEVANAGHFDLIVPDGAGWPAVQAAVQELLGLKKSR